MADGINSTFKGLNEVAGKHLLRIHEYTNTY